MPVSNESIRQNGNVAIILAVMCLGYAASVLFHWRTVGVGVVWTLLKQPISLMVDVDAKYLGWITLVCYAYQSMVQKYATGKIQLHVLGVGTYIMVLLGMCLQSVFRGASVDRLRVCALMPNSLFISGALLQKCTKCFEGHVREQGLVNYLLKVANLRMVLHLIGVSVVTVRISAVFSNSVLEIFDVFINTVLDSVSMYYLFATLFHVYIYNLRHFARNVTVLGCENTEDTLYNYIVISSYQEKQTLDKDLRQKNLEIEYGYLLEVLQNIEEKVYAMVKHQAIKNVIMPQNKIRDLPNIFLTASSKATPLQYDFSNRIIQNIIYYLFTKTVYSQCLKRAETLKPLILQIKDLSWKIELRKKKKIITAMENIKIELEKLARVDTSELSNFLSIWICYFATQ